MMRLYTLRNGREFKNEEEEPVQPKITYKVMLRDYFENEWIDCGDTGYVFEEKDKAIEKRDKCNLREFKTTTPPYDHYCVVEMKNGVHGDEIDCPATFKP